MRELYMNILDVKMLLNASKRHTELKPIKDLISVFPLDNKYLKLPEGYERMPLDEITPICCNLLLTNYNHDGIWLYIDWKSGTIDIPHKNMNETSCYNLQHSNPTLEVLDTIRLSIDNTDDPYINMIHQMNGLYNLLDDYGFETNYPNISFYYSLYTKYETKYNIFCVIETQRPSSIISALCDYHYRDFVWYSRQDHFINMKSFGKKNDLFDYCGSSYDIRKDENGVLLLDKIFHTENLFGKIDIY